LVVAQGEVGDVQGLSRQGFGEGFLSCGRKLRKMVRVRWMREVFFGNGRVLDAAASVGTDT